MDILKFIKEYWVQILFGLGLIGSVYAIIKNNNEAVKCSLRNDMLEIWDKCKDTKTITKYQLESFMTSRDLYYKKKGDGFIHTIDSKIQTFEVKD
jgi:hypothetical protein